MAVSKNKSILRLLLSWVGILSLLGISALAVALLTDWSGESVLRTDESSQLSGKQPDPTPPLEPVNIELVDSTPAAEKAGSPQVSQDVAQDAATDHWRGTATAWGSLSTQYGDVVANETISLYSKSAAQGYSETSDENGIFSFADVVPASDYRLSISPKGMYERVSMESLAILGSQVTLAITLQPLELATLRGRVVNTDNIVMPGYEMKIHSPLKSGWVQNFVPNSIGEFQIESVPVGPVKFSKTFGLALLISGHRFSGESQSAIELVVDAGSHELRGVVYDEFGNAVPGATVVLQWKHANLGVTSIVTRRGTTDPAGAFLFQGLGRGEHELLATYFGGLVGLQIVDIGNDNSERVVVLKRNR